MDMETYEEERIKTEMIGGAADFIKDDMAMQIKFWKGDAIDVMVRATNCRAPVRAAVAARTARVRRSVVLAVRTHLRSKSGTVCVSIRPVLPSRSAPCQSHASRRAVYRSTDAMARPCRFRCRRPALTR